jgi:hypothetical protein
MSTTNLLVRYIAFNDTNVSNNPAIRIADLSYNLTGQKANKPKSQDLCIPAGQTLNIFNGFRSTGMDNTTAFTITRPDVNLNIYRLTHSSGAAPAFRTAVSLGIDGTTVVVVTVNGPLMKIANSSGTPMVTTGLSVGDVLNILPTSGMAQANQGRFTVIAKDASSITVENSNAVAETATLVPAGFLTYSNGAASNQILIGDKIVINGGLSPVSFGTYQVTEVTPEWIEFLAAENSGLPQETDVVVGTQGFKAYSSAKTFVLIAAQQNCSVRCNGDTSDNVMIEPKEVNNQELPGLFLKQGLVYSLDIKNLSLETLNLVVVTSE